jgi:DNA invertase Pin-like site-specific DNA recombinase
MTVCALYARFSTDKQSEASLADQYRVCEARATAEGWTVAARRGDDGVSGSTPVLRRAGGKALMADVLARRVDVVLVEALDRISRDQLDLEGTVRRIEHAGIRIIGVCDGYDSQAAGRKVIRAVRGIVAELYLDDLRAKTHRGLDGRVLAGCHAGGRSFGYRTEPVLGGHRLTIDQAEAGIVREIFERYGVGASCQAIAFDLNRRGVPSPRGGTWAVSAIYGSPAKDAGILSNPLYVGRLVWNRSQWIKDPDTGKRQRIDRPRHEWREQDRPELRILSDEQWGAVRERLAGQRLAGGSRGKGARPTTLFGGLLRCGACGGAVVAVNGRQYGCAARKDRGPTVCPGVTAPRDVLDRRLLGIVREELATPARVMELQAAVRILLAEARAAAAGGQDDSRARAAALDREVGNLVSAVAATGGSPALLARLQAAEAERAAIAARPATEQALELAAGEAIALYREKLVGLQDALQRDLGEARAAVAQLLGVTRVVAEGSELWVELEDAPIAKQALSGLSLGSVAGACNGTQRRYRVT